MALSNEQLLMLDILIYTDYVSNGATVKEIINAIENDGCKINSCEMSPKEWNDLITAIKKDPVLLDYTVTNYINDGKSGMRAACFVDSEKNPTDINVVFRGTCGDYEWHDNGVGGYLSDTEQQKLAANYVNQLPENYGNRMTVTGHSKGGNKAQYVTIVTDRIERCVSYDGQGFSNEFLEKYAHDISEKSDKILSISASYDYVNCLLYPIAGKQIYIETEYQNNYLHFHKPNILLDKNGKLRPETEQSELSKLINEYTTYMISNLDEPERSITIDGLIALLEKGDDKENILQSLLAGGNALSHIDDFVLNRIGEKYGFMSEVLATYLASVACPILFSDDLLSCSIELFENAISAFSNFADEVKKRLESFGKKVAEYANKFVSSVESFIKKIRIWWKSNFAIGNKYATENPYVRLDTYKLNNYAQRLLAVNRRIQNIDHRLDSLYWRVGLLGLWNLIQADVLTGYSWRLLRCSAYLSETAADFDALETKLGNCL